MNIKPNIYLFFQVLQRITGKVLRRASNASLFCFPKPTWIQTHTSASMTLSSSPYPPPSPQPAWTAAPRPRWLCLRSIRDSWASNPASAPACRASNAAAQRSSTKRSQTRRLPALQCGDLGKFLKWSSDSCKKTVMCLMLGIMLREHCL